MSEAKLLPVIYRHANYHAKSGLITSPRSAVIPDLTKEDLFDYGRPRKLSDQDIWLAFYPRYRDKEGFSFARLDVPNSDLTVRVGEDREIPGRYRLSWDIANKWYNLETALMKIATHLLWGHPDKSKFPEFNFPRVPSKYGYMDLHKTKSQAYSAARRSRDAFPFLIALVSFAFALWLTRYEHDCLDEAVQYLLDHGVPGAFLDLLKSSVACDFSPGVRAGGFIDPYFTKWTRFFHRFTRANVPIWFLWGTDVNEHRIKPLSDPAMCYFYPPNDILFAAIKRSKSQFDALPLPVPFKPASPALTAVDAGYDSDDDMMDYSGAGYEAADEGRSEVVNSGGSVGEAQVSQPAEKVPELSLAEVEARHKLVEKDSLQCSGETHQAMFLRLMEEQHRYLQRESPIQKRSRLDKIKSNKTWFTNNSKVYTWEQDPIDRSFWRRRLLNANERTEIFKNAKPWQRFYWSYCDSWDLMFFKKEPPADYKKPTVWQNDGDSDDEDDNAEHYSFMPKPIPYSERTPIQRLEALSSGDISALALSIVRQACKESATYKQEYNIPFQTLASYLFTRFGFNVDDPIAFAGELDKRTDAVRAKAFKAAIRLLGYNRAPDNLLAMSEASKLAVASFAGTFPGATLKAEYDGMSLAWDIKSHFSPNIAGLRVQVVSRVFDSSFMLGSDEEKPLYVLRPPRRSSNWLVATPSATVALLVFRKGWESSYDIASGLLSLGIRFNTVIERKKTKAITTRSQLRDDLAPGEDLPAEQEPQSEASEDDREETLGAREAGFEPNLDDLNAYLAMRRQVLLGPSGRALRLAGGLVGRISAEIVTDKRILMGPTSCNNVIGVSDENEYVDDGASMKDFNIVSGLYVILRDKAGNRGGGRLSSRRSWFPLRGAWDKFSGYADEQWLPDTENWYTYRVRDMDNGKYELLKFAQWKVKVKFQRAALQAVLNENERMSAEFIKHHLSC